MTVWLVTDRPDHPVLRDTVDRLTAATSVVIVDPTSPAALAQTRACLGDPECVVLLKSHDDAAIALGREAAASGMVVINDPDATAASLDRQTMAFTARAAGIAFPVTSRPVVLGTGSLETALAEIGMAAGVSGTGTGGTGTGGTGTGGTSTGGTSTVVVKSRRSRRGDLVQAVDAAALADLAATWPGEEVVLQRAEAFDGWDHKVWVIAGQAFYARRRSPLAPASSSPQRQDRLPLAWQGLVRSVADAYGLVVFGVDIVMTTAGPLVVDVNPFPGSRGVRGADEALAAFTLQTLRRSRSRSRDRDQVTGSRP